MKHFTMFITIAAVTVLGATSPATTIPTFARSEERLATDVDLGALAKDAASHCNQNHAHFNGTNFEVLPATWNHSLQDGDWQGILNWSMNDTGYNEGADAIVHGVVTGLGVPPPLSDLGGKVAGNVWKRTDMMRYAIAQSKVDPITATAFAIMSQWHNCHALACLVYHAPEVTAWLVKHS